MFRIALQIALLGCSWLASAAPQIVAEHNTQPPPAREQLARRGIRSEQSLIDALKNRDADVRILAAMRLGEYDLDAAHGDSIPALAEALRTETEPAVAAFMAAVLGGLGDFTGVRALERMCHDSQLGPRVKLEVARHLWDLDSENCLDDGLDLAFKGDDSATLGVFYFLPKFQRFQRISNEEQKRTFEIIRRGLSDTSPHMRLLAADVLGSLAFAQEPEQDVLETFQSFMDRHSASATASMSEETSRLNKQIASASPEDLVKALPVIIGVAVSGRDDVLRRYGVIALLAVSLRLDGVALLNDHLPAIASLLDSSDAPTQRVAVVIISTVESRQKPPSPGPLLALTAFLKRTDRDVQAQVGAVSVLVNAGVDDDAVAAIDQFLARDLDSNTRMGSLNGLTRPDLIMHPKIIARMITLLGEGDTAVKTTAIDSLTRIGPQALLLAEPTLMKLAADAASPESVRSAAKTALGKIGRKVE